MDAVLAVHEDQRLLRAEVQTAIRPVRFPLAPLWVMAGAVVVIALAGCFAVASGVPVVSNTHAASR
jgi:hypothetical protein